MSNRNLMRPWSVERELTVLTCVLGIAADASVDAATSRTKGVIGTWAKTGTGEYTLTLADKWKTLAGVTATYECATGSTALAAEIKSAASSSGTVTVVVRTVALATGAPADASAACKVHCIVVVKNSTLEN